MLEAQAIEKRTALSGTEPAKWPPSRAANCENTEPMPICRIAGRATRTLPPPDGQITGLFFDPSVNPLLKKYSDFQKRQISSLLPSSRPIEGRLAIVTDAGRDAVDANSAADEST